MPKWIQGKRTFAVCAVIGTLAVCQYFLKLEVPKEVFLALYAAAIAALRAGKAT